MSSNLRAERIDIRLSATAKRLLQAAAQSRHQTLSEFVLNTALTEAEITLAERRQFSLNDEEWDAFQAALDAPPRTHPRLQQLLNMPSVFVGEACT
jgi:uncharacterized protein (DUF1778 family)